MLALRELQAAFAAHIVAGDRADFLAAVTGDAIPAAARLGVYRHHVFYSLASALSETYPTVKSAVGEEFFRRIVRAYVTTTLPVQPVLAEYGEDFPGFIATFEAARDLAYLADVAQLDWVLNRAFHAAWTPALGVADLLAIGTELLPTQRLALQPGAALIESDFPIDRIWSLSQPGAVEETIDPQAGGVRLLVLRRSDAAAFAPLSVGEMAFVRGVADGRTLEEAAALGLGAQPVFDLSSSFGRLLGLEGFAALRQD